MDLIRVILAPAKHLGISLQFRMDLKSDSGIVGGHQMSIPKLVVLAILFDFINPRGIIVQNITHMFNKNQLRSVSPEVAAAMRDLNKEESLSNLSHARLGRRVPLTKNTLSCVPSFAEETLTENVPLNASHPPFFSYSERAENTKEPVPYFLVKQDESSVKMRES
jgi:hypothetical protein